MMQLSYVRRCVFGPVLHSLQMGFTDDFVDTAMNDADADSVYRKAISETIGKKMVEITGDPAFANYIDYDDNRGGLDFEELEVKNLRRMFGVCALYAEQRDLQIVCGHTPRKIMDHFAKQYATRGVVIDNYLRSKP